MAAMAAVMRACWGGESGIVDGDGSRWKGGEVDSCSLW